ncbi:MAG TPA: Hsp33 family molecular chaperone HslO, partial [Lachnospiraceae bacterium]|nr:Hsp33 family molecular chaperone HslO [Lachnospiraceae bacterium]
MADYIVRASAANNQIRAFAATTRELVEYARSVHGTSPVATAALGRLLTAGTMMGIMMKGEKDLLTLQIKGDGPIRGLTVTANSQGAVKGYVYHPEVMLPPSKAGKLDVGGAVGTGTLSVIKDMGLKEPYSGQTNLISGEIAEDLTYYFAASEQVPSSVALGVLMNKNNTVKRAGGFIIQLLPFAEEEVISKLEAKISQLTGITDLLDQDMTPEMVLEHVLGEFGLEILDRVPAAFECDCDKERVEKAIISIGEKDIREMIEENEPIEVNCQFCNA